MSWKYTDEYYKNYTRQTWDECAEKYVPLQWQLVPFHKVLLDNIRPKQSERVLDVCTGPGEPAMTMAEMVAPTGQVVGIDLSENMTQIATKNAAKRKLQNIRFLTMDAEKIEMPAESFDVAVSCFGFQIVTQPEVAVQEILRVMKPGGRAGFTVWSTGDKASAIDVLIGPMLEHATPDENGYLPTPYELGGPGELVEMLQKVGFEKTREVRTSGVWSARTTNEYLAMILEGTPLGHSLGEEDPDVQEMILKKAQENIKQYETPHGVSIPTECVVVLASKPAITH